MILATLQGANTAGAELPGEMETGATGLDGQEAGGAAQSRQRDA